MGLRNSFTGMGQRRPAGTDKSFRAKTVFPPVRLRPVPIRSPLAGAGDVWLTPAPAMEFAHSPVE